MDSLMNMELRGKLSDLGVTIPLAKIMEGPSIVELSETILNMLHSSATKSPSPSVASPPPPKALPSQEQEQEYKQQNELQQVTMKPSFIQDHFVKVYAESGDCNDCHLAGLLSFEFIDAEILQQALNHLIEREISLRTRFETHSPSKTQAIVVAPLLGSCQISIFDYKTKYSCAKDAFEAICNITMEDAKQPFDLSKSPLLRIHLYEYNGGWVVYSVFHHAVLDGVSMLVFWRSLFTTYHSIVEANTSGRRIPQLPSPPSYLDYVEMEEKYQKSNDFASDSDFWKQYLTDMHPLCFPSNTRESPSTHSFTANKFHFVIPSVLVNRLTGLINLNNLTMYQVMITAYMLTLSRICGQSDITIGTTISTRYHTAKWRDILGNFINDAAMRVNFEMYNSKNQSTLELLHHVRTTHSVVMEHTRFPVCISKKAPTVFPGSTLTQNPLYKAMFLFQSQTSNQAITPSTLSLPSLSLQKEKCIEVMDLGESLFDLTMELMPPVDKGEVIEGDLIHNVELFSSETAQSIAKEFVAILEEFAYKETEICRVG